MINIFLIAGGGAFGAVLRHFSFLMIGNLAFIRGQIFPYSTLLVNVLGSFLAGVFYYFMIKNFNDFDPRLKSLLLTGFLGGYTTFSAFSLDFFRLFEAGQIQLALLYVLTSVILAILAIFFGFYLMKLCL